MRILSTPFASSPANLYAGQPISAQLAIQTSFHWGQNSNDSSFQYLLRFNIEEMIQEWLISGPKRGDFVAVVWFRVISASRSSLRFRMAVFIEYQLL